MCFLLLSTSLGIVLTAILDLDGCGSSNGLSGGSGESDCAEMPKKRLNQCDVRVLSTRTFVKKRNTMQNLRLHVFL